MSESAAPPASTATSSTKAAELPADLAAVRDFVRDQIGAGRPEQVLESLETVFRLMADLRDKNAALMLRLSRVLKQLYGRKSERISPEQLKLFLDTLTQAQREPLAAPDPTAAATAPAPQTDGQPGVGKKRRTSNHRGRRPLPAHLPREINVLPVAEEDRCCPSCRKERRVIGYEDSEVLEIIPASFKVIVNRQPRLGCDNACNSGVVTAPPADKPIEAGLPGPALLTDVLVRKYMDHCPLYRLNKIYRRSGVDIPDSTLGDWVAQGAEILEPLVTLLEKKVLSSYVLSTDDTGVKVLDQNHERGIKKGHLWLYVGEGSQEPAADRPGERHAVFTYTPTWQGEGPQAFMKHRTGYIQCDGYAGYDKIVGRPGVIEVGCNAHQRRKWVQALEAGDARASIAIDLIARGYAVEAKAVARGLGPDALKSLRQDESRPLMEQLRAWAIDQAGRTAPKSPLGRAMKYMLGRWPALTRFLEDGRLPIDNNHVENGLRDVACGRRNWLFCGSDEGGRRAAILYSLMAECRLHGIDPVAYLKDVFERLSRGWPHSRLEDLLPAAWAKQQGQNADANADGPPTGGANPTVH